MDTLNHSDYADNLNTKFRIRELDGSPDIELTTVTELKSSVDQESFSLLFSGGKEQPLAQGLYNLEHESLGNGMIFLVPVEENKDGYLYEAVFSRVKPKDANTADESAKD